MINPRIKDDLVLIMIGDQSNKYKKIRRKDTKDSSFSLGRVFVFFFWKNKIDPQFFV